MPVKLYDTLPKLRLVLHANYIPSVNSMYDHCRTSDGVRVYKSAETVNFQNSIGEQIVKSVDLKKYPWINDKNLYITDYKFVLRNTFDRRDTSNMVKATEDAIHSVLQSNDNRVIKCTAQKFNNPEMIQEMIIYTMQPYIGSLSIFDLETAPNEDKITSDNERLCEKYMREIEAVCKHLNVIRQPLYDPKNPEDIGYIASRELLDITHIDDMIAFLRTLKFLGITLRVVTPKRSQWIRMIAPNGQVCEMYDAEIRDRYSEGYTFGDYNYITLCD